MKITIETPEQGKEDEIIIRCAELDDDVIALIMRLRSGKNRFAGYSDDGMTMLAMKDIYYFEAVDNKVFAYCEKAVYEVRKKLYELEEMPSEDLVRISKSVIVNISYIDRLVPMFSGKLEAKLTNGESVIISRQYVGGLKQKLGI